MKSQLSSSAELNDGLSEIVLAPVDPRAVIRMLGANGLCTSTTARCCWLVPLLWIANKTVQFTCEGKAALAAICCCWCCWCCWVLLAAAGLWQLCPAAGRQAPTARCLLLPADLPRQLTDLFRPLGILVEETIAGIMFLFRVLHHSA